MRITGRQVDGLIVCVLLTAAVCLFSLFSARMAHQDVRIAQGDPRDGPVVVRLSGDLSRKGIYYLPKNTTLLNLLTLAGVDRQDRFDKNMLGRGLFAGQTVTVGANGSLTLGQMDAAERLALDLPIDLNRATQDELMLVPGIGETTADRIVQFRNTSGLFRKVADLKNVPGIKEKKFKRWERYFFCRPTEQLRK
jgi:competence ComEA-like helix-hairpin-helix protein